MRYILSKTKLIIKIIVTNSLLRRSLLQPMKLNMLKSLQLQYLKQHYHSQLRRTRGKLSNLVKIRKQKATPSLPINKSTMNYQQQLLRRKLILIKI